MVDAPVDIVDRHHPVVRHGTTWHQHLDGALDHISRLLTEHDNALHYLEQFLREHPEFENDHHLTLARVALL